jgi:hypothetical protein
MAKADKPDATPAVVMDTPLTQSDFLAAIDRLLSSRGVDQSNALTPDALKEILASNARGVQKAMRPENETAPDVGAFNPGGGEKPILQYVDGDGAVKPRTTYFCGNRQREDMLTPLEITLFNAITKSTDARDGAWKARVVKNGGSQELHIVVPVDRDRRTELPSLVLILRELVGGRESVDPDSMAAMKAQIEALTAASVPA